MGEEWESGGGKGGCSFSDSRLTSKRSSQWHPGRLKCGQAIRLSCSRWGTSHCGGFFWKLQIAKFTFTPSKEELVVCGGWLVGVFSHICPLRTCFWPLEVQTKPLQMAAAPVAAAGWLGGWSAGVFLTQGPSVRRLMLACKRPDVGSNINQRPATANHTLMVSPGGFLWGFQMIQFQKFPCCSNKRWANGIAHERKEELLLPFRMRNKSAFIVWAKFKF